ncbi:MAG TPA: Tm-1-like ATP-binding domain-containing protein [Anaerolineae bacterium]|nr:Tm-1-like ATP-binding domain-containing protein [Anaerolineae bacterium]
MTDLLATYCLLPSTSMTILLIGTLDTKGREIAYCRDKIRELGADALVLDSGILGEPLGIVPDITRAECAIAAGTTLDALRNAGTRGAAVERMREGVRNIAVKLFEEGKIHGVLCLGGAEGAVLGSYAMRALPIGVPKVIVTPIASGQRHYGQLMGTRDIFVVHSVIDILGINPISRAVFDNACGAVVGMVNARAPIADSKWLLERQELSAIGYPPSAKYVAITMLGNTTKAVMHLKDILAQHGYEAIIFHSNGVGGPAMEELAEQGMFVGVIDYTTDELSDQLIGGFHAGGDARLERVGALGIPQVVVPGCVDFTVHGRREQVPEKFKDRPAYYHNPEFTLIRLTRDEEAQIGRIMAGKLNGAQGPVIVIVPTQGLSIPNVPGGVFWDRAADAAFLDELRNNLREEIPLITVDAHINDPAFSQLVAEEFLKLMGEENINGK